MVKRWPMVLQRRDGGEEVEMVAPYVISASRRTDVPSFHLDWFFERLRRGYCGWVNPFSGARSYVSFSNTCFVVFWTKDASALLGRLTELSDLGIRCCILYTLNDYGDDLEPIGSFDRRLESFRSASRLLGACSVVWRFDPLVLTRGMGVAELLERVRGVGDALRGYTRRLVFSFVDIGGYAKVRGRLIARGVAYREWSEGEMCEFAQGLSELNREQGWDYELRTCSEGIDLSEYGIAHNGCVDGDCLLRIVPHSVLRAVSNGSFVSLYGAGEGAGGEGDGAFMSRLAGYLAWSGVRVHEYSSNRHLFEGETWGSVGGRRPRLGVDLGGGFYYSGRFVRDSGQRSGCGCSLSKDIGQYASCWHGCAYCYASGSERVMSRNREMWESCRDGEFMIGG